MFKVFSGKFHSTRQEENQEQDGKFHPEVHFTDPRNKRVEEMTHKTENNGDIF
jgi:hypothetical protein